MQFFAWWMQELLNLTPFKLAFCRYKKQNKKVLKNIILHFTIQIKNFFFIHHLSIAISESYDDRQLYYWYLYFLYGMGSYTCQVRLFEIFYSNICSKMWKFTFLNKQSLKENNCTKRKYSNLIIFLGGELSSNYQYVFSYFVRQI